MTRRMKVLFCASEVFPFAKTGGLADVSGALPLALAKQDCQLKVALPKYRGIKSSFPLEDIGLGPDKWTKMGRTIDTLLIANDQYFERPELYGEKGSAYPDNFERFNFFCKRLLYLLKEINFAPDIIHCNDWQTGLIPVYLKSEFKDDPFFKRTKTVFTIHNLAYQGIFPHEKFIQSGLSAELFNMHALEFYGQANLLKGGMVFSHFITTVSPTYAQEIQTPEFGCGLDGVLRERQQNLLGIINGIDYALWDPATDKSIFKKYGPDNLDDKYVNKEKLQQELNLTRNRKIPLLGIVTRLAEQKGIELIASVLNKIAKLNLQFILLGTGDQKYHLLLERFQKKHDKNISLNLRFDPVLAHKIYAGCDMFLMPSYYEPCGLGQLISLKYGTIPVVRKTGGLADTIVDFNSSPKKGNGFVFTQYQTKAMLEAIMRAVKLYQEQKKWRGLMHQAAGYDFSWEASAKRYLKLYQFLRDEK